MNTVEHLLLEKNTGQLSILWSMIGSLKHIEMKNFKNYFKNNNKKHTLPGVLSGFRKEKQKVERL